MSAPASDPPNVLFHVEEQEVIYWRTAVEAVDKEAARTLITNGSGEGELVGKTVADRRITTAHLVTDHCPALGCYDMDLEELVDDA